MKSFPQPLTAAEEKYYMQKYTEGDLEAKHISNRTESASGCTYREKVPAASGRDGRPSVDRNHRAYEGCCNV